MLNTWIGTGRITKDLELKQVGTGTDLLNFSIAVERNFKNDKANVKRTSLTQSHGERQRKTLHRTSKRATESELQEASRHETMRITKVEPSTSRKLQQIVSTSQFKIRASNKANQTTNNRNRTAIHSRVLEAITIRSQVTRQRFRILIYHFKWSD